MRRVVLTALLVAGIFGWGFIMDVARGQPTSATHATVLTDVVEQQDAADAPVVAAVPAAPAEAAKAWEGDSTVTDVVAATSEMAQASKTGKFIPIASALIFLLLALCKLPALKPYMLEWIPKRWFAVVPVLLGVAAGILYSLTTGVGMLAALTSGLVSGGGAIALHEVLVEAIGGGNKSRTCQPSNPA